MESTHTVSIGRNRGGLRFVGVLLNHHGAVVETTKTTVKELNPLLVAFA